MIPVVNLYYQDAPPYTARQRLRIGACNTVCDATVLAVLGARVLVEYVKPTGAPALRMCGPGGRCYAIAYRDVGKRWLVATYRQSGAWLGQPALLDMIETRMGGEVVGL